MINVLQIDLYISSGAMDVIEEESASHKRATVIGKSIAMAVRREFTSP